MLIATPLIFLAVLASVTGCQSTKVHTATVDTSSVPQEPATSTSAATAGPSSADPTGAAEVRITWKPRDVGTTAYAPILTAYKAFITTSLDLKAAPDSSLTPIDSVATGTAKTDLEHAVSDLRKAHQTQHGAVTFRPWIIKADFDAGTSTVEECADFSHYFQGNETKPVPASNNRPLEAKLSRSSAGTWQVASFALGEALACTKP